MFYAIPANCPLIVLDPQKGARGSKVAKSRGRWNCHDFIAITVHPMGKDIKETISEAEVRRIAKLANLNLEEKEALRLTGELNSILGHVNMLSSIDTKNVQPMSHVQGVNNVFREDIAINSLTSDDALKNAPDRSGNFFRTPLIVE